MVGSMALCVPSTRGDVTMPAGPTVSALREVKPSDVRPLGLLTQPSRSARQAQLEVSVYSADICPQT